MISSRLTPGQATFLWLVMNVFAELAPVGLLFGASQLTESPPTFRELLGYSTFLLLAFAIFLATLADVIVDELYRRADPWPMAIIIFLFFGISAVVGVSVLPNLLQRQGKEHLLNHGVWIFFEVAFTVVILSISARTRVWGAEQRRRVLSSESEASGES